MLMLNLRDSRTQHPQIASPGLPVCVILMSYFGRVPPQYLSLLWSKSCCNWPTVQLVFAAILASVGSNLTDSRWSHKPRRPCVHFQANDGWCGIGLRLEMGHSGCARCSPS